MKSVLKTHVLMILALIMSLQPLYGMNQIQQLSYKNAFLIFGSTTSALLVYAGYKKWQQSLEDKKPRTVQEITEELDEDLQTFLELLFIFNQKDQFKNLYNKESALYTYYNTFIQRYRTGLLLNRTVADIPRVKHFMQQLNSLKPLENEIPLIEIKKVILNIATLIHDFIKNYIDKEDTALNTFWSYILRKRISSPNQVSDIKIQEMILNLFNNIKNFIPLISELFKQVERPSATGIKENLFDSITKDLFIRQFIDEDTKQFKYDNAQQFVDQIKKQMSPIPGATFINSLVELYLPNIYSSYIKSAVKKGKQEKIGMED